MESGLFYLFLAYSVLWMISFGYIFLVGKRYKDLRDEVSRLEKILNEGIN